MTIDIWLAIALIAAAFIIGFLLGRKGKTKAVPVKSKFNTESRPEETGIAAPAWVSDAPDISDRGKFDAAIAASIASYMGSEVAGLRIRSVKPLSRVAPRQPMVAAMSAAIATHMGTDVSALRIHSIRPIGAAPANRQQMVAAISAAIATAMNAETDGLRIRSIKKIS
ncbi:MAG TPA: hypothetical protein VN512_07070 [Clostridia bacterium]|nr:hypothetical protein [Clostridia bacterium]